MAFALLVITAACLCAARAKVILLWKMDGDEHHFRNESVENTLKLLSKPQMLDRDRTILFGRHGLVLKGDEAVNSFSWRNCGSSSDPVILKGLTLSPDPIVVPGSITVSFDAVLNVNITSPLEVDVTAKKKMFFIWIEVPCVDNIGSCKYSDVCSMVPTPCPEPIVKAGLPCKCPVSTGHYQASSLTIQIPNIPLPSFIEDGDFQFTATGSMGGKKAFCYKITFSLEKH